MDRDALLAAWRAEARRPFSGWDFPALAGRLIERPLPWSYMARAAELLRGAGSALDLDTGGAERLIELRPSWPARLVATEGYPPNTRMAAARLAPLGVPVVAARLTDDGALPFRDRAFDLVLNRHAAFNPAEVARALAPGGTFLTQQVHGRSLEDLIALFGAAPQWPDAAPAKYLPRLRAAGLAVAQAREWSGPLAFADVGAIAHYLTVVPWLVPGFDVDTHADTLLGLQRRLDRGEPLAFLARSYLIESHRPAIA